LGAFVGHKDFVKFTVEKDINTLITGSPDRTLKAWDMTTRECICSVDVDDRMSDLIITNDKSKLICRSSKSIEIRRASDLGLISTSDTLGIGDYCCELEDGSFVSDSDRLILKRWSENGSVLQTFIGHSEEIRKIVELNSDILLSSTRNCVKLWKVSTGECLQTLDIKRAEVMKFSRGRFVTWACWSPTIRVWNEQGSLIDTIPSETDMTAMARVRDMIVTSGNITPLIVVRRLKK